MGKCNCGECDTDIPVYSKRWQRFNRYKFGHWINGRVSKQTGKRYLAGKYWYLYKPEYFSSYKNGCVQEHVFVYQEYYKLCMLPWGDIHHIDDNPSAEGANRIENLQAMMHSKHAKLSHSVDMSGRKCSRCETTETYKEPNGSYWWFKDGNSGFWCKKCYDKMYLLKKKKVIF